MMALQWSRGMDRAVFTHRAETEFLSAGRRTPGFHRSDRQSDLAKAARYGPPFKEATSVEKERHPETYRGKCYNNHTDGK